MGVTIRQVAEAAGVSIATVSKAMNDSYSISEETKENIRLVAARLGYKPNARAQSLARQATQSVYFIGELGEGTALRNPHMFEILLGAEKTLGNKGYSLTVRGNTKKGAPAMVRDVAERKAADGFLLHASVVSRELTLLLAEKAIPHIVIGQPNFPTTRLCWIDNDNQLAGELAAQHVLERRYARPAFIGGTAEDKISMSRLEGCEALLREHGRALFALQQGKSTVEDGERMAAELLALPGPERPDILICANNNILFGAYNAAAKQGLAIPAGVAVIAFDDHPFAEILTPAATSVSIDVFDMGIQAAKLLLTKIKKPDYQVRSYTTLPRLQVRGST